MLPSYSDILPAVLAQLAIDLNCSADDFGGDGFVFRESRENPGRRPFPRDERHFEMLTTGGAVVVSATADILPRLREQLDGKSRDDAFSMPFVRGFALYFLPDDPEPLPPPDGIEFEFIERRDIPALYAFDGFRNALQYDINHPRPDALAITAKKGGAVIGAAGASADCETLWQIGVDVLPGHRRLGIAAALTNRLALEILRRGKIPYYGTAASNIASQRTARRAGFAPAWAYCRGSFDGTLTQPTG